MEQEQHNENLDSTPPKKNLLAFFDAIRLKHIVLLLLCLLFLGILIGGGSNERPAKRLAIKNKKCNTHKSNSAIKGKEKSATSIENLTTKSKEKIGKIGGDIKNKTGEVVENANTSIKKGKEKIENAIRNTGTGIKKETKENGEILTGKKQNLKNLIKKRNSNLDEVKPKLDGNSNSLAKGLNIDSAEKKGGDINKLEVEEKNEIDTDNNTEVNSNKSSNSKSMESEIDLLKEEINQLKSRIDELNTTSNQQNETTTLSNDMNFINKRIEFWQSVKETAEN